MDVKGYRPDSIPPGAPAPIPHVRVRQDPPRQASADKARPHREDRVEILPDGRKAVDEAAEAAGHTVPEGTLPADQLLEMRRRIQARVHESADVIDETVRRMVERGDL